MKQIKACLICGRAVGKSLIYQAQVEYLAVSLLTGEKSVNKLQGYVCPVCNKKAGYHTSEKKLKKFLGKDGSKK